MHNPFLLFVSRAANCKTQILVASALLCASALPAQSWQRDTSFCTANGLTWVGSNTGEESLLACKLALPVRPQPKIQIQFSPNPATTLVTVSARAEKQARGMLILAAANGRELWRQHLDLHAGIAETKPLPVVAAWPSGQYFWRFVPEGSALVSGSFIKL